MRDSTKVTMLAIDSPYYQKLAVSDKHVSRYLRRPVYYRRPATPKKSNGTPGDTQENSWPSKEHITRESVD